MKVFQTILQWIREGFEWVQQTFQAALLSQQLPYFIEEIDVSRHMLVVRCRGTRSIMKMSYVDIIPRRSKKLTQLCSLKLTQIYF